MRCVYDYHYLKESDALCAITNQTDCEENMQYQSRKLLRLNTHHYDVGSYFITICTHRKQSLFGTIDNGSVELSDVGEIVEHCLMLLPNIHRRMTLVSHIVMPDHIHAIVALPNSEQIVSSDRTKIELSKIIQSFKASVTKSITACDLECPTPIWQKSYYDRIIRNQDECDRLCEYIRLNPQNAASDPSIL